MKKNPRNPNERRIGQLDLLFDEEIEPASKTEMAEQHSEGDEYLDFDRLVDVVGRARGE